MKATQMRASRASTAVACRPADKAKGGAKSKPDGKRVTRLVPQGGEMVRKTIQTDDLRTPQPLIPIGSALAAHFMTLCLVGSVALATPAGWIAALIAGTLASFAVAVAMRGLENLVHGCSHFDIFGRTGILAGLDRGKLNDFTGNVLMAMPVIQSITSFRQQHLPEHHGRFGQEGDPCRQRMIVHPDTLKGALPTVAATLASAPREALAFYRLAGSHPGMLVRFLLWHALVYVAPVALFTGWGVALIAWFAVMVPTFTVVLPAIRALAEAGEHDYREDRSDHSVAERTFAHEGPLNRLIHPFGDQRHPEHHIWPTVPQYRLETLKTRIVAAGLGRFFRRRTTVLGIPSSYDTL